jgi:hypothetical protein
MGHHKIEKISYARISIRKINKISNSHKMGSNLIIFYCLKNGQFQIRGQEKVLHCLTIERLRCKEVPKNCEKVYG